MMQKRLAFYLVYVSLSGQGVTSIKSDRLSESKARQAVSSAVAIAVSCVVAVLATRCALGNPPSWKSSILKASRL